MTDPQYVIAKYIPEEARRAAVKAVYAPAGEEQVRRTETTKFCPLGVCAFNWPVLWDALVDTSSHPAAPGSASFANALATAHQSTGYKSFSDLLGAASAFITAWDNGTIVDLAAALGVES